MSHHSHDNSHSPDHDHAEMPPFARRRRGVPTDPEAPGAERGRGPRFARRDPGGFGPPWWVGAGGRGFGRGGGHRRRRGDVRAAIITLLGEEPMHGYQIIKEIAERSDGRWQPSPGSVYPTLQALEDEGVVRAQERDAKRVFELTDEGRERLAELATRDRAPWDLAQPDPAGFEDLREQMAQLGAAFVQVLQAGSPAQRTRARALLAETRRGLYAILASDDETAPDADAADADAPPDEVGQA
jgi:DNA-binding PadR family transcriptional regulator